MEDETRIANGLANSVVNAGVALRADVSRRCDKHEAASRNLHARVRWFRMNRYPGKRPEHIICPLAELTLAVGIRESLALTGGSHCSKVTLLLKLQRNFRGLAYYV